MSSNSQEQTLQFSGIYTGGRANTGTGFIKLIPSGITYKSKDTGNLTTIPKDQVTGAEWLTSTRGCILRVNQKDGSYSEFVGFSSNDYDAIDNYFSDKYLPKDNGDDDNNNSTAKKIKKSEASLSGYNWGDISFKGKNMLFSINGQQSFSINCHDISQSTCSKNELAIEFHEDESAGKEDEVLTEIRFQFPTISDSRNKNASAEEIHKILIEKAELGAQTSEAIVTFSQLPFVTPRGRYDMEMYGKFLRLRGKTYDNKVLFTSISAIYLLPKPGDIHMYLVLSLGTPVRQGQTPYYHLVIEFDKEERAKEDKPVVLALDKETLDTKYANKGINKTMTGKMYEIVARMLKALTDKKIVGPGEFKSFNQQNAIKCSLKANEGYLFMLNHSMFFLHKPPTHIRHSDIKAVKFQRNDSLSSSRTFDVKVTTKADTSFLFSNIMKVEYDKIVEFLTGKGIKIENPQTQERETVNDESESDDDDYNAAEDDSEDEEYNGDDMDDEDGSKKRSASSDGNDKASKKARKE